MDSALAERIKDNAGLRGHWPYAAALAEAKSIDTPIAADAPILTFRYRVEYDNCKHTLSYYSDGALVYELELDEYLGAATERSRCQVPLSTSLIFELKGRGLGVSRWPKKALSRQAHNDEATRKEKAPFARHGEEIPVELFVRIGEYLSIGGWFNAAGGDIVCGDCAVQSPAGKLSYSLFANGCGEIGESYSGFTLSISRGAMRIYTLDGRYNQADATLQYTAPLPAPLLAELRAISEAAWLKRNVNMR